MKIIYLTSIGRAMASAPSNNDSPAMRILFWLRRHGGQGTDEQIIDQLRLDGIQVRMATNSLLRNNAIRVIGG